MAKRVSHLEIEKIPLSRTMSCTGDLPAKLLGKVGIFVKSPDWPTA